MQSQISKISWDGREKFLEYKKILQCNIIVFITVFYTIKGTVKEK